MLYSEKTDANMLFSLAIPAPSTETINALQAFRKRNADAKAAHAQVKDQKTDVSILQWDIM